MSSIAPVDLFGSDTNPDVDFQPRWTGLGTYDFNYQPGGSSDPLGTAGRRSTWLGASSLSPWLPPQQRTRSFAAPAFRMRQR